MAVAETVLLGSLASLIASGISRVGSVALGRYQRLSKINTTLKSEKTRHRILGTALDDFRTVMGTYRGELTIPLDKFLTELGRTGLVSALAEAALLEEDPSSLKSACYELYKINFPVGNGDFENLYNAIYSAFKTTFQNLYKDEAVAELVKASNRRVSARLQEITSVLDNFVRTMNMDSENSDQVNNSIELLSKAAVSHFRYLSIETNRGRKNVEISKIYIPATLSSYKPGMSFDQNRHLPHEILRFRASRDGIYPSIGHEGIDISYQDLKNSFQRIVVLGDPGGGKTTLCQNLCYEFAKHRSLMYSSGNRKGLIESNQKFPIRIILRNFEAARSKNNNLPMFDYIVDQLLNLVTIERDIMKLTLSRFLVTGEAVIAFDGLDEVLDTSKRREYVTVVEAFANQFPLCPVIVTSRAVGYDEAPLNDEFESYYLARLNEPEIKSHANKFLKVVSGLNQQDAEVEALNFFQQTNDNAHDLRSNPLLLGLMLWLFYMRRDVPENLPEIYRECAQLMFERWDSDRGIRSKIPGDFVLFHLFSFLANEIYSNANLEQGVSEPWLKSAAMRFFIDQYEEKPRATEATEQVVKFLVGRAWIMSEVGESIFKFTHTTFLEYFFARHVHSQADTVKQLFGRLKPKIYRGQWDVVAQLALQLMVSENPRRTEEALNELIKFAGSGRGVRQCVRSLAFSAKALSFLPGPEAKVRELVKLICGRSLEISDKRNGAEALEVFDLCSRSARERRTVAQNAMAHELAAAVRSGIAPKSTLAEAILSETNEALPVFSSEAILPARILKIGRDEVKDIILHRAKHDPYYAKLSWEWFGEDLATLFKRYGLGLFLEEKRFVMIRFFGLPFANAINAWALSTYRSDVLENFDQKENIVSLLTILAEKGLDDAPYAVSSNMVKSMRVGIISFSGTGLRPATLKNKVQNLQINVRIGLAYMEILKHEIMEHSSSSRPSGSSKKRKNQTQSRNSLLKHISLLIEKPSSSKEHVFAEFISGWVTYKNNLTILAEE